MNRAVGAVRSEAVRLFEEFLDDLPAEEVSQFVTGRKVVTFLTLGSKVTDLAGLPVSDACRTLEALTAEQVKGLVRGPSVPALKRDIFNFVILRTHGKTFDQEKADQKAAADAIKAAKKAATDAAKAAALADKKAKEEAAKAAERAARKVVADLAKAAKQEAAERARAEKKAEADAAKAAKKAAAAAQPGSMSAKTATKRSSPALKLDSTEIFSILRKMDSASEARTWLGSVATVERLAEIASILGLKLESGWAKPQLVHEIVYAAITGPRTLDRAQS